MTGLTPQLSRRDLNLLLLGAGLAMPMRALAGEPPNWRLGFQTPPEALDGDLIPLRGKIPDDLEGVFFRAGPAQFERAGERLGHWFDGDGMIQRFVIAGGRARHRGRFVDTRKRRAESEAGRFLYSGYGFSPRNPTPFTRPDDINAANTNVLAVADELWALWEGGSPYRLDAESLATIGPKDFGDGFTGLPFSAHPKRGRDGEIWNFGGFGARHVIWRLGPDGALLQAAPLSLPQSTLMHDFAVTERFLIFIAPPMRETAGPAPSLIDRFAWKPDEALLVAIHDKNDLSLLRTCELPAKFLFHIGNAYEDKDGAIFIDAFMFDDPHFATEDTRDLPLGRYVGPPSARPTVMTLHPDGAANLETMPGTGEFPRIDPRRVGLPHRYTYSVIGGGVARTDWRSGRRTRFEFGPDYWAEEPVFVPRGDSDAETAGWVLQTRLNLKSERTELAIFDARRMEDGPIAELACPYPLPLGFHGTFSA